MAGIGFGANATSLSAPQGSGAQVVAPVEKKVSLGFVEDIAKMFAKDDGKDRDKEVLAQYSKQYDRINQGIESGGLTPAQGTAEAQKLYSRTLAANAHLAKDLNTLTEGFRGNSSMSEADKAVAEQKALRKEQLSRAAGNGWVILPGMAPVVEDDIIRAESHAQKVRSELEAFYKKVDFDQKNDRYDRELSDREYKQKTISLLAESTGLHIDAFTSISSSLAERVKGNPALAPQAQAELAKQFTMIKAKLQAAAGVEPALAGHYTALFTEMYEVQKKLLDPSVASTSERTELDNQVNIIKLKAQKLVLQDPTVRAATVNSLLLSNSPAAQLSGAEAASNVMAILGNSNGENGEFMPQVIGNPDTEKAVLKGTKDVMDKLLTGKFTGDPAKFGQQSQNLINNVLKDIGKQINEPGKLTPKGLSNVLDLVSDPSFGKLSEQGKMNPESRQAVKDVLQAGVNAPMVRLLDNKLNTEVPKGYLNGDAKVTLSDLVKDIKFSGAGVSFEYAADPRVVGTGASLFKNEMKDAEKALTKVIRAAAHVEGHTDYQKAWESIRPALLPNLYRSPQPIEVGTIVKAKDGVQFKYLGGPDGRASSWQQLAKPTTAK